MFIKIKTKAQKQISGRKTLDMLYILYNAGLRAVCLASVPFILLSFFMPALKDFLKPVYDYMPNSALLCVSAAALCPALLFLRSSLILFHNVHFQKLISGSSCPKIKIKTLFKSYLCSFYLFGIKMMWLLFFLLPFIAGAAVTHYFLNSAGPAQNVFWVLLLLSSCFLITGLFFWFAAIQRYSLAYKLIGTAPVFTVSGAIRESAARLDKSCLNLTLLKISFIPWLPLCFFMLPCFYVLPYRAASIALFLSRYIETPPEKEPDKPIVFMKLQYV
ncbi:MAG: DUF975 family protein [Oscillospiraceae bacterium]|nr:DUF975 family protein [Oscillospiraceae bacterium]